MSEAIVYLSPEGTDEQTMLESGALIENDAKQLTIVNDEQYEEAAELARTVKTRQKIVQDYFAPLKKSAHDAHKQICDRETQALKPLKNAEQLCKRAMGEYVQRKQEEARRQEAEMRRLAREEAARKLEEAAKAESAGDQEAANSAMQEALVADQLSNTAFASGAAPKVKGVSTSKDWEIVSVDDSLVPVTFAGAMIRPVDLAALKKLIKATDGNVQIPGVVYRETVNMSVSSRR